MCYFIHLAVTPQGKPADAEAVVTEIARRHKLILKGYYPDGLWTKR